MSIAGHKQNRIVSAVITTNPTKTTYSSGDVFDPSGMVITVTYENGSTLAIDEFETTDEGFVVQTGDTYIKVLLFDQGQTITVNCPITTVTPAIDMAMVVQTDQSIVIYPNDASDDYEIFENGELLGTYQHDGTWHPARNLNYPHLTFTSPTSFTIFRDSATHNGILEYSIDNIHWTYWDGISTISSAQQGDRYQLLLRGTGNTTFTGTGGSSGRLRFNGGNITVSGKIEALVDYLKVYNEQTITLDNYSFQYGFQEAPIIDASNLQISVVGQYAYSYLFSKCASLITGPVLSATTLDYSCYSNMFEYCTAMTGAPALPATNLSSNCYAGMFVNCESLITPPALPATTLTFQCYASMFTHCISLATAPVLSAMNLASYCYSSMFFNCDSLTTAPALPATVLAEDCYYNMFGQCNFHTAPELPATTLAKACYERMFNDCTSLTTAPELPATTLANYCYEQMFNGCTSLTTAPELPATTLAIYCYYYMFRGCSSLTTAPALPATTIANGCYNGMFSRCTSLITAPELPATTLASQCYYDMFYNCKKLERPPELPATTLAVQCYGDMFNGCSSLKYVPQLPATTLVTNCYYQMFYGCTSLYVSTTSGEGYSVVWQIPQNDVGTLDYTMSNMFSSCLGTRDTDSPNFNGIQKTYYTQNEPI